MKTPTKRDGTENDPKAVVIRVGRWVICLSTATTTTADCASVVANADCDCSGGVSGDRGVADGDGDDVLNVRYKKFVRTTVAWRTSYIQTAKLLDFFIICEKSAFLHENAQY